MSTRSLITLATCRYPRTSSARTPDSIVSAIRPSFARRRGSVAAPTAGLHFTPELLLQLEAAGVERAALTLHVGYGTFKPMRAERVEEHTVDPETYEISEHTASAIGYTAAAGRRVVVVGTTSTRAVESAHLGRDTGVRAGAGTTDLFITPGFEFGVVDALLTNFHLPRSSLLMLVCAFGGTEHVLRLSRSRRAPLSLLQLRRLHVADIDHLSNRRRRELKSRPAVGRREPDPGSRASQRLVAVSGPPGATPIAIAMSSPHARSTFGRGERVSGCYAVAPHCCRSPAT